MPRLASSQTPPSTQAPPSRFSVLKNRLNHLSNLATYDSFVVTGLREIHYPCLKDGTPLAPQKLWRYSKTHAFPDVHCFHDLPARIFTVKGDGPYSGLTNMACHFSSSTKSCNFWISVDQIASNFGKGLSLQTYPRQTNGNRTDEFASSNIPSMRRSSPPADDDDNETAFQEALALSLKEYLGGASASANPSLGHRGRRSSGWAKKSADGSSSIRVISPPSSQNSVESHFGLEVPPLGHPNRLDAIDLYPSHHEGAASVRHVTPELGNVATVLALTHEKGVPADTFWKMFVLCRGCDHVMTGDMLECHICDLTK